MWTKKGKPNAHTAYLLAIVLCHGHVQIDWSSQIVVKIAHRISNTLPNSFQASKVYNSIKPDQKHQCTPNYIIIYKGICNRRLKQMWKGIQVSNSLQQVNYFRLSTKWNIHLTYLFFENISSKSSLFLISPCNHVKHDQDSRLNTPHFEHQKKKRKEKKRKGQPNFLW